MRIVVDENIPFILPALQTIGEVTALPGAEITPAAVADADALLTRTRTRCDEGLLADSQVRFVGTATIGTDHIDIPWCEAHGITVANAPGCNAPAVAQWVMAAVDAWLGPGKPMQGLTIGVIGAGHVGEIVIRWAKGLGMNVLVCDPPREEAEAGNPVYDYSPLQRLASEADVLTVHVPLTRGGSHPTYHMLDGALLESCQRKPLVLNASRGAVADTASLIHALDTGLISAVGIDCWEGEPDISTDLLRRALIATPHIAGYSREGKVRATQMILDALAERFHTQPLKADAPAPAPVPDSIARSQIGYPGIIDDTAALRRDPSAFESLRNNYPLRPEPGIA